MYSPKIKEDLIPVLYKLAKHEGKPMTRLLDEILRSELRKRGWEICQEENKAEISMKLKKRTYHRRFEEFSERQIHRVGLWAPVLSTSFE
jgi:hypothetical protein